MDERGATWRVYLTEDSLKRILTIDVESGVIAGLSRSGGAIECLVNSKYQGYSGNHVSTKIHVQPSMDALHGLYTLVVFGSDELDHGIMECITKKHCDNNTTLVFLNAAYQKIVNKCLHNNGFAVFKAIAKLPANNPRIYIPIESRELVSKGLCFHKPGRMLSRIALKSLQLLNNAGLRYPLNRNSILFASKIDASNSGIGLSYQGWIEEKIGYPLEGLVAYAGSESTRRKFTLLAISGESGRPDIVVKVGDTKKGKAAIRQESKALAALVGTELEHQVPALLFEDVYADGSLVQGQSLCTGNCDQVSTLTETHINALKTLSKINPVIAKFSESPQWETINKNIHEGGAFPTPVLKLLGMLEGGVLNGASSLFHFTHGDFAPWNILACDNGFFVYDWEDSRNDGLMGSDLFYYLYRQADLIGPWPGADKLHKQLLANYNRLGFDMSAGFNLGFVLGVWLLNEYCKKPTAHLVELADIILRNSNT